MFLSTSYFSVRYFSGMNREQYSFRLIEISRTWASNLKENQYERSVEADFYSLVVIVFVCYSIAAGDLESG